MILQNEHFWKFSEENRKNGRLSNEEIDTYSFPRKLHGGECCAKRAFVGEKNNGRRKQQSSRNCGQSLVETFTGTYQVSDR